MADWVSDDIARTFGRFPPMDWSLDTHTFFAQDIRARIKTVMQGALTVPIPNDPVGKVLARHPDCPFALLPRGLLPKEPLAKIFQYVAGSNAVQKFFKPSKKPWYNAEETKRFKIKKPLQINGVIIDFHCRVVLNRAVRTRAGFVLRMDINGLPLQINIHKPGLYVHPGLDVYFSHPVGVNNQGWEWKLHPDGSKRASFLINGDWNPSNTPPGRIRLVLRPYGNNFAIFPSCRCGTRAHTWVNQAVTEHGPSMGVAQGAPAQLPCQPIHDVFDSPEFCLVFIHDKDVLNCGEVYIRDLRIMFF